MKIKQRQPSKTAAFNTIRQVPPLSKPLAFAACGQARLSRGLAIGKHRQFKKKASTQIETSQPFQVHRKLRCQACLSGSGSPARSGLPQHSCGNRCSGLVPVAFGAPVAWLRNRVVGKLRALRAAASGPIPTLRVAPGAARPSRALLCPVIRLATAFEKSLKADGSSF